VEVHYPDPNVIYASDQVNCATYGMAGLTCFQALNTAYNQAGFYNAAQLIVVGTLTVDPGEEAVITRTVKLIRGINSGQLIAGVTCSTSSMLTLGTNNIVARDFSVNGAACSGAATGIVVPTGGNVTLDNVTVMSFTHGTGIAFTGTGAGLARNSHGSIVGNQIGLNDTSSGVISVGTGPTDGNTFTNNQTGLRTNGGITIKGNDISGGVYGVELTGAPTAIYGNRIVGASIQQVFCNGAGSGAAWNYLGGMSPTTGSNCSDVQSQLGGNFVSWADGGVVTGLSVTGAVSATFDLGANLPFGYGSTVHRISNYFAIYGTGGTGNVTVAETGRQYKMFAPPNTGGVCLTGAEATCWESAANGRAQMGTGYFFTGNFDPTAVTVSSLTATANTQPNDLRLAAPMVISLLLIGAGLQRRRIRLAQRSS
jgi:hypothetical protein